MLATQLEWSEEELLASDAVVAPLIAGGVRCHGGFDRAGQYRSPRTKNRLPAITAWQDHHRFQFGTELIDIELDAWPPQYPNVAQAKYLIGEGVPEPIISALTRIGTVEGFGSMIRYSIIPELQTCFVDDVRGTAMAHLGGGLYEAHARDEAGHGNEGGHKQMWFAARDVAFEHPVTADETERMMERMGIVTRTSSGKTKLGPAALPPRLAPEIDADLELLIARMANLLLIEVSAFHTFAWAEEVLSDHELVAGDGEAAQLVSFIRADEVPHVEYLKCTLTEIRDRTFLSTTGKPIAGTEIIGRIWENAKKQSLGARRAELVKTTDAEVGYALTSHRRRDEILDQFHALAT